MSKNQSLQEADFTTVRDAADMLGVTPAAVYARIDSERLTKRLILGTVAVLRTEIEAWRAEREADARRVLERTSATAEG